MLHFSTPLLPKVMCVPKVATAKQVQLHQNSATEDIIVQMRIKPLLTHQKLVKQVITAPVVPFHQLRTDLSLL